MEVNKNKLYLKQDILDILNNILRSCDNKDYQLATLSRKQKRV